MMRGVRLALFFALLAALLALPLEAEAAKKKDKVIPMKVIKPSEAPFKQAKIAQKKKVKAKRFLWFKKKGSKEPARAVTVTPARASLQAESPPVKKPAVLAPASKAVHSKPATKAEAETVDLPDKPVVEAPPASAATSQP